MLFDSHTHFIKRNAIVNIDQIENVFQNGYFYSLGLHPWKIKDENIENDFEMIEQLHHDNKVIAIGECGIDRAIDTSVELQINVFNKHLQLSKKLNKPIIIHCVRAYSDIIGLLVKSKFDGKLIFHDYRGNQQQTEKLSEFKSYFSFGKSLLADHEKIRNTIKRIPTNRILLETDNSGISIENIYICATKILKISRRELEIIVSKNMRSIYGDSVVGKN